MMDCSILQKTWQNVIVGQSSHATVILEQWWNDIMSEWNSAASVVVQPTWMEHSYKSLGKALRLAHTQLWDYLLDDDISAREHLLVAAQRQEAAENVPLPRRRRRRRRRQSRDTLLQQGVQGYPMASLSSNTQTASSNNEWAVTYVFRRAFVPYERRFALIRAVENEQ